MAHGMNANKHNSHPSSERKYERFITFIDKRPVGVRRLFCAGEDCGQQGEILDRTNDGLPPALIERRFRAKGWEVGKNEKHDFCPTCVEAQRIERRQRRKRNRNNDVSNVVPMTPSVHVPQGEGELKVSASTESPQEMSRSDRRIIFAKLEEVYESEDTGYKPGWSDAQVARDLGSHIPVGWVSTVREENFGPVKDNAEIRDMLVRVQNAALEAKALIDEVKAHKKMVETLVQNHNALMERARDIAKNLDGLLVLATRIERVVS